ncbi:hypothetical protein GG344DRAFT_66864 [Lentinula edodes]|nr:hypothetical protein GG344DRAFT_66864 [Lentinula edodes]
MTILTIVSLLVLSAIPTHAQFGINDNFHHNTTTRIIAAVVVVVLVLLALALFGTSYRRRQQRRLLGVQNIVLTRPPPPPGYWSSQGGPVQEPYAYNVPPQGYDPAAYSPPSGPPPKDGYYGNGGYAPPPGPPPSHMGYGAGYGETLYSNSPAAGASAGLQSPAYDGYLPVRSWSSIHIYIQSSFLKS